MSKRRRRKRRKHMLMGFILFLTVTYGLLALGTWAVGNLLQKNRETEQGVLSETLNLQKLSSKAAVLTDLSTGKILAEKKGDERIYPASLTKIMTVVLAMEKLDNLDDTTVLDGDMFRELYAQGASMAGFAPQDQVSYWDLLYGALLPLGAECCEALARVCDGSEEAFVKEMNQKAKKLGMKHTNFKNVTGLHDKGHYTTAEDLSLLLEYALKNQEFYEIFTAKSHSMAPTASHPEGFTVYSTMRQEMEQNGISEPGILGGKTGYTSEAGLCLGSLLSLGGKEYILITADAPGSHETEPSHILDAAEVCRQLSLIGS